MVTNYPQEIAAGSVCTDARIEQPRGVFTRTLDWLQHAICGLHGHDALLHFERDRMFLRCTSCGHETPGWEVGKRKVRVRFGGDARRHQATQPHIVPTRRIA